MTTAAATGIWLGVLIVGGSAWCFGLILLVFGWSFELQPWVRGIYHALMIGFPFALLATLYTIFKAPRFTWTPAIILGGFALAWSLWNVVDQVNAGRVLAAQDRTFAPVELDGWISLKVPMSFQLDDRLQLKNFYGLEPVKDKFTYLWRRETYPHISGPQTKSYLALRLCADGVPSSLESTAFYDLGTFDFAAPVRSIGNIQVFRSQPETKPAMIYLAHEGKALVALSGEDGYLDEATALKMLETIVPSLNVNGELIKRYEEITEQFYRDNPDKRH